MQQLDITMQLSIEWMTEPSGRYQTCHCLFKALCSYLQVDSDLLLWVVAHLKKTRGGCISAVDILGELQDTRSRMKEVHLHSTVEYIVSANRALQTLRDSHAASQRGRRDLTLVVVEGDAEPLTLEVATAAAITQVSNRRAYLLTLMLKVI